MPRRVPRRLITDCTAVAVSGPANRVHGPLECRAIRLDWDLSIFIGRARRFQSLRWGRKGFLIVENREGGFEECRPTWHSAAYF